MRLLPPVVSLIRTKECSYSTEKIYTHWIKRFIRFRDYRHSEEMGELEIIELLSHLANENKVSSSRQNQALNVLVFLYRCVLGRYLKYLHLTYLHPKYLHPLKRFFTNEYRLSPNTH